MAGLLDLLANPIPWLLLCLALFAVEAALATFYAGGFAVGAFAAGLGLYLFPGLIDGWASAVALWGAGTFVGLTALRLIYGGRESDRPDINDEDYSGDA